MALDKFWLWVGVEVELQYLYDCSYGQLMSCPYNSGRAHWPAPTYELEKFRHTHRYPWGRLCTLPEV